MRTVVLMVLVDIKVGSTARSVILCLRACYQQGPGKLALLGRYVLSNAAKYTELYFEVVSGDFY